MRIIYRTCIICCAVVYFITAVNRLIHKLIFNNGNSHCIFDFIYESRNSNCLFFGIRRNRYNIIVYRNSRIVICVHFPRTIHIFNYFIMLVINLCGIFKISRIFLRYFDRIITINFNFLSNRLI